MTEMSELRLTDTNSVNDSKGRALGLEGNDFLYVIGAIVAGLATYLVMSYILGAGTTVAVVVAIPVLVGPITWALVFRRNKPEGYAEDFFDQAFNGEGWSFAPHAQPSIAEASTDEQERA